MDGTAGEEARGRYQSTPRVLRKHGESADRPQPNTERACRYSMEKTVRIESGTRITLIPALISLNLGLDISICNDIRCAPLREL